MWRDGIDVGLAYSATLLIAKFRGLMSQDPFQANWVTEVSALIELLESHASKAADSSLETIKIVIASLRVLKSDSICRQIARGAQGDIVSERERLSVLIAELKECLAAIRDLAVNGTSAEPSFFQNSDKSIDTAGLLFFLRTLAIPVTYWKKVDRKYGSRRHSADDDEEESAPPLVKATASLDNDPLVSPMRIRSSVLYSLNFSIRGTAWPKDAEKLCLDLVTTCPMTDFSASEFTLAKPSVVERLEYEGVIAGHLSFKVAQSMLAENVVFAVRGAFKNLDGSYSEVPVIGDSQLEFKVVDLQRAGIMSGYQRMDQHIADLLEKLVKDSPSVKDELQELIPLLEALNTLLGAYAQSAYFKETTEIGEREFQRNVVKDLRLRLGQDVEEHPSQAGGSADIRYRGVIVELKVEKDVGSREKICAKYTRQPVQYEGVEARQVSVVLVLDLTEKTQPTGDIRNDVRLVDVATHGHDGQTIYVSKVFVFVVNGNIRSPSEYSH
jgi:hypothetical protein